MFENNINNPHKSKAMDKKAKAKLEETRKLIAKVTKQTHQEEDKE